MACVAGARQPHMHSFNMHSLNMHSLNMHSLNMHSLNMSRMPMSELRLCRKAIHGQMANTQGVNIHTSFSSSPLYVPA